MATSIALARRERILYSRADGVDSPLPRRRQRGVPAPGPVDTRNAPPPLVIRVSIVIATFGDPRWRDLAMSRAYPSALDQGAAEIICAHEENASLAAVRNSAAYGAHGADYLVFLDADDELAPGYIDAMRSAWMDGAITDNWDPLLVPAVSYIRADGRESRPGIPQEGRWPELNECVIGTGVRRDLFVRLGGFRDQIDAKPLDSLEDYDLWLRCYDAGASLIYVSDAVYRAPQTPQGRNSDQSAYCLVWCDHVARVEA
jgi:glycosyltransferase involved in cell wall biosynthesis